MTRAVDAVVVGSGQNGLIAAAYLAQAGWDVEVLERNAELGGAIASAELTLPGFVHDPFSAWHPLFYGSATYAELGDELGKRGLHYVNTDVPAGTAFDGETVVAYRDPAKTAEGFSPADRSAYLAELQNLAPAGDIIGELFASELWSPEAVRLGGRLVRRLGPRGAMELLREVTSSARAWFTSWAEGPEPARLWAPWTLHTGMAPDDAGSGFQLQALAGGLHAGGMPIPEGGAARFVDAFRSLIEDHGGRLHTGVDVTRIAVRDGRATGVIAGEEEITARRAVIANVTPTQLYGRLLPEAAAPPRLREQARRYRYGRAGMQLHFALSEPPRWRDDRLREAAMVHVAGGLDSVTLACAQATAGLLPAAPTIACGQPTALDPSRAPEGRAILWIQLLEVPYRPRGDAAGELDVGDGTWSPALVEAFSDRVLAAIGREAPNVPDAVLGRAALSPIDLERSNINLVAGDPYSGATTLDQSYIFRPLPGLGSHAGPVGGLFLCGAATHPGPGLSGASGRLVARRLLRGERGLGAARQRLGQWLGARGGGDVERK